MDSFDAPDGEEMWASRVIDDTQQLIGLVRDLAQLGVSEGILREDSERVLEHLSVLGEDRWPALDVARWKSLAISWPPESTGLELALTLSETLNRFVKDHLGREG